MTKGLKKIGRTRKAEIIKACEKLYKKTSFKDITVRDISKETSVGRTSFYTYFQTKDELFLTILTREYQAWAEELIHLSKLGKEFQKEELASAIAETLDGRTLFLKILSENPFDMEANCREKYLQEYQAAYAGMVAALVEVLDRFCPKMSMVDKQEFIYAFLPFLHGIYPYTAQAAKQAEAMQAVGIAEAEPSAMDLAYAFLCVLLIS